MSLDISLTIDACEHCGRGDSSVFDRNYTYNVTPMWRKAGCYDALYMSHGRKAGEYIDALDAAVADMENDPPTYKAMNPSNGWGSYDTALPWLREVRDAFKAHPTATIWVSK